MNTSENYNQVNIIIYGPDKPKIGFKQSPDGSISFRIENERTVRLKKAQKNITWEDLNPDSFVLYGASKETLTQMFQQFIKEIATLTDTTTERKFFLDYASECLTDASFEEDRNVWDYPALIPQVWVNWIHYDPKDSQRAERAQKEPFRVDFLMKDQEISPNLIIFEIDGLSHFADMEVYTRHLQKDRWLRKQGWEVFRISNFEVEQCNNFDNFYHEITGKWLCRPF